MDDQQLATCSLEENFPLNTGVIIPETLPESDFIAGTVSGIEYLVVEPTGDWTAYRSRDEQQHGVYFDSMACVTFSALNSIEMQINRLVAHGQLPEATRQALQNLGFFDDDGKFNASDRFTAKMSGTTRQGNTLNAVWESIRKHGILPERDWPFPVAQRTPVFDWDNFYADISPELQAKARESLKYLDFLHEWVITGLDSMSTGQRMAMQTHLLQAPLQVAAAVCRGWGNGDKVPVPNCGSSVTQHATVITKIEADETFVDVDHYNPFVKKLAADYPLPWVKKGIVVVRSTPPQPPRQFTYKFDFTRDGQLALGQRSEAVRQLQSALVILGFLKPSQITGYYWYGTAAGVKAWQEKYQVASPMEIAAQQGKYFGPKGMAMMNKIFNL